MEDNKEPQQEKLEVTEEKPQKKKYASHKPKRVKQVKYGTKDPEKNLFVRMQLTEEGRALWKLWTDKRFGSNMGRPRGSTQGYTKVEREKVKKKAKEEAKIIVEHLIEKGYEVPKNEFAAEAIKTAVEIMRREDMNPKDKLAAARTVLEWTMAKPAQETTVNVKKAEDFLRDIAIESGIEEVKQLESEAEDD